MTTQQPTLNQAIIQETNPPDRSTGSTNTMEIDHPTLSYKDRLVRDMIFNNPLFQEEVFFSLKKNSEVKTFEDILNHVREDKTLFEAFATTALRLVDQSKTRNEVYKGSNQKGSKNIVKIFTKSENLNKSSIHPTKNMEISILGNSSNTEYPPLKANQEGPATKTNTAEFFKVKNTKSSWKTVELSTEDLCKYAEGDLSLSTLHYLPMQHRYLYFAFKTKNNASIRLSKTFLANLKIDTKYVAWIEHVMINKVPHLELIVRNRIAEEVITKVSQYLTFKPELCPEKILNGSPTAKVVPQPQKDFLSRVLVTVEKLKLLNFRPQCRKFLEKLHALAMDEQKETSKDTIREQVTGPATTKVAPPVPVTSVAAPTGAQTSVPKKTAATAKPSKEDKGKVIKTVKVTAKPKAPKKVTKEEAPKGELLKDPINQKYIEDYLCGKQPENQQAEIVYGFMQASGAQFGDDDFEDL